MSLIDEQIKKLTLVKKKIEFAQKLKDPKNLGKWVSDYPEIKEDMMKILSKFSDKLVASLEKNYSLPSLDGQETLKHVPKNVPKKPQKQNKELPKQDKITFALENRRLADQKVNVRTEQGVFKGKVIGLDAPFVIVRLDSGATVQREIQDIQEL